MIENLIQILITLFLLFFGLQTLAQDGAAPPPINEQPPVDVPDLPDAGEAMRVDHVVENINVNIMESFPVQISLDVSGFQPDGCDLPVMIEQAREGSTVTVEIYRNLPPDTFCPMNIVPFEQNIPLDGGFEPGTYTIIVNGVSVEVEV